MVAARLGRVQKQQQSRLTNVSLAAAAVPPQSRLTLQVAAGPLPGRSLPGQNSRRGTVTAGLRLGCGLAPLESRHTRNEHCVSDLADSDAGAEEHRDRRLSLLLGLSAASQSDAESDSDPEIMIASAALAEPHFKLNHYWRPWTTCGSTTLEVVLASAHGILLPATAGPGP